MDVSVERVGAEGMTTDGVLTATRWTWSTKQSMAIAIIATNSMCGRRHDCVWKHLGRRSEDARSACEGAGAGKLITQQWDMNDHSPDCVTHRLVLDRLVIMEPAVGKLPELQVRKLTRKNQTHSALFIAAASIFCCSLRFACPLKPGEYPPRFEGEVTEWTLQRKLGMATDKYVHGKVITASYLLEQISVTLFGAIAIFGDMLSDVYMAYSRYNDKQYEELSGTLCGWSYQSSTRITGIVFAVWFLCSFIYAAKILAITRRQHLSRPTSFAPPSAVNLVRVAFNVPLWMLDLANPQQFKALLRKRTTGTSPLRPHLCRAKAHGLEIHC